MGRALSRESLYTLIGIPYSGGLPLGGMRGDALIAPLRAGAYCSARSGRRWEGFGKCLRPNAARTPAKHPSLLTLGSGAGAKPRLLPAEVSYSGGLPLGGMRGDALIAPLRAVPYC